MATDEAVRSTARHTSWLPLAAIAVTVVLWASAFVAIRHVGHEVSAGALSLGRLLVASLVLGAFVWVRRDAGPGAGGWPTGGSRALALGRTCYDHLAGRLGVAVTDAMAARGLLDRDAGLALTQPGLRSRYASPPPAVPGCAGVSA